MVAPVGYVGRISEAELAAADPVNYSATNAIGKVGIEKHFEEELHGKVGYQQEETDAAGRVVRVIKRIDPQPGTNLYLTIDSRLQAVAQEAFGGHTGGMVAIDPRNGQVLALVSNASYDPNLFVDGITSKQFHALQQDPGQPLYNRAVRGQYPFGSTIKPFIALQGLDTGTITPSFGISDPGWFKLPNSSHIYHDWKRTGHGYVTINTAIRLSCDTFFFTLANRLGIQRIDQILDYFGFGKKTNIEINEELPGLVPTPAWKQKARHQAWYPGDTLNAGIGQGSMLATPLQLATMTARLVNDGREVKPVLIRSIEGEGNKIPVWPETGFRRGGDGTGNGA